MTTSSPYYSPILTPDDSSVSVSPKNTSIQTIYHHHFDKSIFIICWCWFGIKCYYYGEGIVAISSYGGVVIIIA